MNARKKLSTQIGKLTKGESHFLQGKTIGKSSARYWTGSEGFAQARQTVDQNLNQTVDRKWTCVPLSARSHRKASRPLHRKGGEQRHHTLTPGIPTEKGSACGLALRSPPHGIRSAHLPAPVHARRSAELPTELSRWHFSER